MLLRNFFFQIIRKAASDPQVQRKAAATYEKSVKPRIKTVQKFAKENMDFAQKELRDIAKDTSPLERPGDFLKKARERLLGKDNTDEGT